MSKKNLITAANHPIAYQLAWHIKQQDIYFGDVDNQQHIIPSCTSNSFAHQFLNHCLNHCIDRVFPLQAQEITALAQSYILFEEFGIELMCTPPAVIQAALSDILTHNEVIKVNNFTAFSAAILKAGYPTSNVWFGKADLTESLYQINDAQAKPDSNVLSFLQASKLLNQTLFKPLHIYTLPSQPYLVRALCTSNAIFYNNVIDKNSNLMFKNIQAKFNLKGFFELTVASGKLLFLKTLTACN
jgi:hypothetical protein